MAGIGADQFALVTQPLGRFAAGIPLRLPVDVDVLALRADELARDAVTAIDLVPIHVFTREERLTEKTASRAARYGATTVFFLDEQAYPEPGLFRVKGDRPGSVVIAPDAPSTTVLLLLRNAGAPNRVSVTGAGRKDVIQLAPWDKRRIDVPIDVARGASLVTFVSALPLAIRTLEP